ncbi:Retrovirus-related Pol polyprotein from transposon 17.6, partial [Mucuna pruriens]
MNATIKDLKTQIGPLANTVSQLQSSESSNLPSQTIPNPRGNQLLRSADADADAESDANSQMPQQDKTILFPFPTQTLSTRKPESNEELLKMFRKVEINIPLLDAIKKIPKYAKFLKELCVHKRKKMKGSVEIGGIVSVLTRNEDFTTATRGIETIARSSEEDKLLNVLRQHKKAIVWKLSDLLGINPSIYLHRNLMEEESKSIRQQQRRMNPTILDVIIYPISDSQRVSPVQVVPKKSGMTITKNQHDKLKIESSNSQGSLSFLPLIDKVLKKLAGKSHYYFPDGFSGYMQIHIAPEDQYKVTFTCAFGTFAYTRMPFGLCNALSTFQCCMTSIFSDLLQECMEVFMDDFTVYVDSFNACLENLSKVLTRCINTNLVLRFEKCHFMVIEGIVLGHLVSNRGIEVDKAKVDIITSLPNPTSVWEVHSFLGHVGFYRRFIKNFSKIALPLSKLLQKDVEFKFDQPYIVELQELKNQLTSAPILQAPNWELPFKLMCDASNSALRAVLGQRAGIGKPVHVIAYASRTMDPTQLNYITIEKELLEIVFAQDKFLVVSNHAALRFLLKKPDAKSRLIRWMLLLQEFNIEIRDKKGTENSVANQLSRIEREDDPMPIKDEFLNEQLLHITTPTPWFADICNFVAASQFPPKASRLYRERLQNDAKYYIWDDPYLWRLCNDQVIRRCILNVEINSVL